ncbi:MAG TPA: alpha/beta fold hydrolase [Jatrophihabitans sp.]|nr:alpha/beta fold hydrolase [Jatrophihabitans sp.]
MRHDRPRDDRCPRHRAGSRPARGLWRGSPGAAPARRRRPRLGPRLRRAARHRTGRPRVHAHHPGFDGTHRPEPLDSIRAVGALYAQLLATLDLDRVEVIGNSIGGWIGAELVSADPDRVGRLVLVDAVGLDVPEHPLADFFALELAQIADYSYADPGPYRIDPARLTPEQRATMAANRATLATYGSAMVDPTLRDRLAGLAVPTLVVWGDADRIAVPEYGRAYADAIPGARFVLLERTGHLPQLESPGALLEVLDEGA